MPDIKQKLANGLTKTKEHILRNRGTYLYNLGVLVGGGVAIATHYVIDKAMTADYNELWDDKTREATDLFGGDTFVLRDRNGGFHAYVPAEPELYTSVE